MKEKVITKIINEMLPSLNNEQLKKLKDVLEVNLYNFSILKILKKFSEHALSYGHPFLELLLITFKFDSFSIYDLLKYVTP